METEVHTLYALPHSLYSGRARSYLIKQNISFRELSTGHESFKSGVLPNAKLPTIPTLVTSDGQVIRDGAAIIEYFEAITDRPSRPRGPRQQIVSALFDVIGTDGLLRPAMHYRWNFPDDNLAFIRYHFYHAQRDLPERRAKTEAMMDRMRHAAMIFGVTERSSSSVEALYLQYLDALEEHFTDYPYLLGWRPCIGDYGLVAPMYAHLGRDPHPARLMQQRATRVFRWVERMNRIDHDMPEYLSPGVDFLADDSVPDTLVAVLRTLAEDFVPETLAAAAFINDWLEQYQPESGSPAVGRLAQSMGSAEFTLRGETITALAQPYRFYLLQRVQDTFASLSVGDQAVVSQLLSDCNMRPILSARLCRRIVRSENLEVWQ